MSTMSRKAWLVHCYNADIIEQCGDAELRFDGEKYIICYWRGKRIVDTQTEEFYHEDDILNIWESIKRYYI